MASLSIDIVRENQREFFIIGPSRPPLRCLPGFLINRPDVLVFLHLMPDELSPQKYLHPSRDKRFYKVIVIYAAMTSGGQVYPFDLSVQPTCLYNALPINFNKG